MLYDCPCQTQTATSFATGLQADMACLLTIYLRDSLSPKVDLSHSRGLVSGLLCGTMPGNIPVPLFLSRSPNLLLVLTCSAPSWRHTCIVSGRIAICVCDCRCHQLLSSGPDIWCVAIHCSMIADVFCSCFSCSYHPHDYAVHFLIEWL